MRVGVVGCGYWGSKHVRVLSSLDGVQSVVAIDRDVDRRKAMVERFRCKGAADLTAVIDDIDAVVVAVPPGLHRSVAEAAIVAGKHVLVEKPMATSVADAAAMMKLAREEQVVLMVGHTFEFNGAINELRQRIQAGDLGDIRYLDAAWLSLGLYQQDVNVLWDLAPHGISVCNYLLDAEPVRVGAWGSCSGNGGLVEDVAMMKLEYEDPAVTAYIRASWLDPAKMRMVTAVGTKRMAVFDDLSPTEPLRLFDRGVEVDEGADYSSALSYRYGDIVSPYIPVSEPLAQELQHFVETAAAGTSPRSDGARGLAVVAALDAADRALSSGMIVDVAEPVLRPHLDYTGDAILAAQEAIA